VIRGTACAVCTECKQTDVSSRSSPLLRHHGSLGSPSDTSLMLICVCVCNRLPRLAVVLSPPERRAYLEVHAKAAALWASVRHFSPAAINQKLLQIMALLLPLRREWTIYTAWTAPRSAARTLAGVAADHGVAAASTSRVPLLRICRSRPAFTARSSAAHALIAAAAPVSGLLCCFVWRQLLLMMPCLCRASHPRWAQKC
jgi:hypothetical protein